MKNFITCILFAILSMASTTTSNASFWGWFMRPPEPQISPLYNFVRVSVFRSVGARFIIRAETSYPGPQRVIVQYRIQGIYRSPLGRTEYIDDHSYENSNRAVYFGNTIYGGEFDQIERVVHRDRYLPLGWRLRGYRIVVDPDAAAFQGGGVNPQLTLDIFLYDILGNP